MEKTMEKENRLVTTWKLDPAHSELLFRVRHLMISNVKGEFRTFNATLSAQGDNFLHAKVEAKIDAASIFTNNENRDQHLRSADFFDAEMHPTILFKSDGFNNGDQEDFELTGTLTMKGVSQPISLHVEKGGVVTDPYGNKKAGFSFSGKLNRKDFGLNWNAALESGGVMVSDEIRINGEVQFTMVGE